MKKNCIAVATAFVLALAALNSRAWGGPLYFTDAGGPNTWDNGMSATDWSATSGSGYNQLWASNSDAVFDGTAGTVNVSGTISSVNSINFTTPGYTLTGSTSTITLTNTGGGTGVITATSGSSTIGCNVASSIGLTKQGAGTLLLTNSTGSGWSTSTTVSAGTLEMSSADMIPNYAVQVANGANVLQLISPQRIPIPGATTISCEPTI